LRQTFNPLIAPSGKRPQQNRMKPRMNADVRTDPDFVIRAYPLHPRFPFPVSPHLNHGALAEM
jgi:hypothetical protein